MSSSTFWCPHPWDTLSAKANGDIRICCLADYSDPKPVTSANGEKITVENLKSLNEYYNSPSLCSLRKEMIDGKRPEMCRRCWELEDSGGMTERSELVKEKNFQDYLTRLNPETGELKNLKVKHIDFAFSNSCNLKCKMCTPWASDQLINEFSEMNRVPDNLNFKYKNIWNFEENLKNLITQSMPTLDNFVIVGGEPLINNELFKCLKYISETENAENIQLRITTNLTVVPERFLEILSKFKSVHFLVSIDAVYDMHEYIRYPSKFNLIEKNLNFLLNWDHPKFWIEITTCIMSWNLFEFSKTLEYFSKYSQHPKMRGWVPWFNYVTSPDYACPEAIPKKLRIKAELEISNSLERFFEKADNESDHSKLKMLKAYANKMTEKDDSSMIFDFLSFNQTQDSIRKINTISYLKFMEDDSFTKWRKLYDIFFNINKNRS